VIAYDIRDLTKIYPKQSDPANDHVTLQIGRGEIFGLLGDNGAGKTTLVRQMVNLLPATSGTIELFGKDVTRDPLHVPTHVGYMPQEARALNNLSVAEALFFTARLRGMSRRDARRERDRLMARWEIDHLRDKYSSRLSGGELRLLRLAVAMMGHPPVLILDEPTNDLAPQRRRLVWEMLGELNREEGTTIIFITHDAIEAERAIQRVGIMQAGKLVAVGAPSELKREVDRKLRLELFFAPSQPPQLPPGLDAHELQPGRWIAWIDRHEVNAVLDRLALDHVLDSLEDFRLYSATLEDLYVHYTTQP
jgi:ABC-type multidrug transport system ATPase subunit